tara:strand:- start:574 stop:798 length:225 start_codon:yes stop_codon:yes gene_type:complete
MKIDYNYNLDNHKCISSCHYASNHAKILKNSDVEVITLYRYGKPCKMVYTKAKFISWINDINKESKQGEIYNKL